MNRNRKMAAQEVVTEVQEDIVKFEEEIEREIEEDRELKDNQDYSGFFYFSDDTDWSKNALMPRSCVSSR